MTKFYVLFRRCFCTVLARQAFTSFVANFFHFVWDGFGQFLDVFLLFLTEAHEGAANVAHRLVKGRELVNEWVAKSRPSFFKILYRYMAHITSQIIQPISISQKCGISIWFFFIFNLIFYNYSSLLLWVQYKFSNS